jgi:hypothetical protein
MRCTKRRVGVQIICFRLKEKFNHT